VKQYVKLLKGKRLMSVAPVRDSASLLLGALPGWRASIAFRVGQTRGEGGSSGCVIAPRRTTAQGSEESGAWRSGCWRNGFKRPVLKHGPRSATRSRVFGWKTRARNESESRYPSRGHRRPSLKFTEGLAVERVRCDPKDGELFLRRAKPEETLVEARSGSDVQIDRRTWV
jgi:hypothetical protein